MFFQKLFGFLSAHGLECKFNVNIFLKHLVANSIIQHTSSANKRDAGNLGILSAQWHIFIWYMPWYVIFPFMPSLTLSNHNYVSWLESGTIISS